MMVMLALMALPVSSQEARFGVRGERLPVQHLTTFRAQPDEVEEAFVLRVGTFLERFSAAHGHEACAALVLVDDRLVARVSTNGSHVGCLAVTQAGDRYTGRSIHSHPRPGVVRLNLADNVFLRGDQGRQGPARRASMTVRPGVSPTDRRGDPGYLVEGGLVVFFSPDQPDRIVGPVADSPLPVVAVVE